MIVAAEPKVEEKVVAAVAEPKAEEKVMVAAAGPKIIILAFADEGPEQNGDFLQKIEISPSKQLNHT